MLKFLLVASVAALITFKVDGQNQNHCQDVKEDVTEMKSMMEKLLKKMENCSVSPFNLHKDCADLYKSGVRKSGVYTINVGDNGLKMQVYCDMVSHGGGWTMFQRRQDGSVDFYRTWNEYKQGFGNLDGEFWLGNENIHLLSQQDHYTLRVDLEDHSGTQVYALYDSFSLASEALKYKLAIGSYSGNAGDSLRYHNGIPFSTKDRDNDTKTPFNCAIRCLGGWWYNWCINSNLNGKYGNNYEAAGVNWQLFKGYRYSLKKTTMKMRPAGFSSGK